MSGSDIFGLDVLRRADCTQKARSARLPAFFRAFSPDAKTPHGKLDHKINGTALRYEVAISVMSAEIIWVSNPYPAGEWSDLRIMRDGLVFELLPGEKVIVDCGYCNGRTFTVTPTDGDSKEEKK